MGPASVIDAFLQSLAINIITSVAPGLWLLLVPVGMSQPYIPL
jgi:hypothetical protein